MQFFYQLNLPTTIMSILTWLVIGLLFFRLYKGQADRPMLWKALLIVVLGIFSFSINFPVSIEIVSISILPLGVWILYLIFGLKRKRERWLLYRRYAWFGFACNYIFLVFSFFSSPLHDFMIY